MDKFLPGYLTIVFYLPVKEKIASFLYDGMGFLSILLPAPAPHACKIKNKKLVFDYACPEA
jgi:hypothetical protein